MARPVDRRLFVIAAVYFLTNMGLGVINPFLNLHFARIGLSGSTIGLISAVLPLGGIFGPPLIATFADARGRVGRVITLLMVLAGVAVSIVAWAGQPWIIIPMVFLFGVAFRSVPPLVDATAMQQLEKSQGAYGRLRLWGSFGFMCAALGGGFVSSQIGIRSMIGASAIIFAGAALCGKWFPTLERPQQPQGIFAGLKGLSRATLGGNFHRFAAVLVIGQLAEVTHYTFYSVHLDRLGIPASVTGVAWSIGVASEMLMLWHVDRLLNRFGVRKMVAAGFIAGAIRWGLTSFVTQPAILLAMQTLHAFTFGAVYAGTVRFVHQEVPKGSQATGQAVITGARAALAGVLGTSLIGYLSDVWSIPTLFAISSVVAVMAAVLMLTVVKDPGMKTGLIPTDGESFPSGEELKVGSSKS